MDPSLQPLLALLNRLPDGFRDIRTEVENAMRAIDLAPSLAVVPPRKVLDLVIREVYERCVHEPPGTRPLEGLTQRLVKEGHLPPALEGYASLIRQHGNAGAHHAGKVLTAAHARDALLALVPILDWYVQGPTPGAPAPLPPVPGPPGAGKLRQASGYARRPRDFEESLHLGRADRVWPLFHQGADPTRRTYLIHRCAALSVDPEYLARHLLGKDPSVRQGLLLALGEYKADQLRKAAQGFVVNRVLREYRDDPDPGVHSAAEWLLRRWGMGERLRASPGHPLGAITKPRWEVNGQGQTFAVIPAPGAFEIGSQPDEKGRVGREDRRRVQIDYPFAVGLKLVTVAEFKKFPGGHESVRAPCGSDVSPYFSVDLPALEGRAHRLVTARRSFGRTSSTSSNTVRARIRRSTR
jgi:hypothetical protein